MKQLIAREIVSCCHLQIKTGTETFFSLCRMDISGFDFKTIYFKLNFAFNQGEGMRAEWESLSVCGVCVRIA